MVCRSTPGNSALTTYARLHSDVDDVQVLSMFHEQRSGAPSTAVAPSVEEHAHFLAQVRAQVAADSRLTETRRSSLLSRLDRAREQRPDAATYYAWRTISDRSVRAHAAMQAHFQQIADRYGATPEQVQTAFRDLSDRNRQAGRNAPQPPTTLNYDPAGIPQDRATRYAFALLHASGPSAAFDDVAERRAREQADADGAALADHREWEADEAAAGRQRCTDCGEFAADGHVCAVTHQVPAEFIARARAAAASMDDTVVPAPAVSESLATDESIAALRQALTADGPIASAATGEDADAETANALHAAGFAWQVRRSVRRLDNGRWQTTDGRTWESQAAALYEQRFIPVSATDTAPTGPTERCDDCGEFAGPEHVCAVEHQVPAEFAAPSTLSADVSDDEALAFLRAALTADGPLVTEIPANPAPPQQTLSEANRNVRADGSEWVATDGERFDSRVRAIMHEQNLPPQPVTLPEPVTEPAPAAPARLRTAMRSYGANNAQVRMTNVSQVRGDLRAAAVGVPVTVDVESTRVFDVRYGYVAVSGTVAATATAGRRTAGRDRITVASASEGSLRCTCQNYARNYDCEHVRQVRERVQAVLNDREAVATAPMAAQEQARTDLYADYQQAMTDQQQARDGFNAAADGVSYAASMDTFQSAWDDAKARIAAGDNSLPYMTENATGGLGTREGGRSFGIEIEVDFADMDYEAKNRVAREMHEAGLTPTARVNGWHHAGRATDRHGRPLGGGYSDDPGRWSVEFDRSVDDVGGQRGCEIVSPIMYDTPETWANIAKVCEIVERNGGKATPRTGLHVNVGAGDFNHTVGNHNRLLQLSSGYEDVIVRCSHNPQSGRVHRGRAYCGSSSVPASGYTSIRTAQVNNSHRSMINLDHVPAEGQRVTSSTRVEVRIFDGSTDKGRIQTNIKVALGLVNAAARGVQPPAAPEPAGTHRTGSATTTSGRPRRLTGDAWEQDTKSFREFADAIFTREEDKKQLVGVFASSRWQAR